MSVTASSTFVAADGDGYEVLMGRWSRRLCEPFLDFAGTEPDERILDVGCGTGSLAEALVRRSRFSSLRGVDYSPVYIEHAAGRIRDPRVTFEVGDACALNLPDGRARNFTRPMTRPDELANAWRAAGFVEVSEATLAIRMEFASFDDYWAPYEGKDGPGAEYIATLSATDRTRLRDAVRLAYIDGEADGPRSYGALAWAVKGTVPG